VVVAVSKGMWAVKLYTNKLLQFLTAGAGKRRFTCIMAVKRWFVVVVGVSSSFQCCWHCWLSNKPEVPEQTMITKAEPPKPGSTAKCL